MLLSICGFFYKYDAGYDTCNDISVRLCVKSKITIIKTEMELIENKTPYIKHLVTLTNFRY